MNANEIKPMLHSEHLEQLMDSYGLPRLLHELAQIAYAKADHVQTNWQDKQLAQAWTRIGDRLGKFAHETPRL